MDDAVLLRFSDLTRPDACSAAARVSKEPASTAVSTMSLRTRFEFRREDFLDAFFSSLARRSAALCSFLAWCSSLRAALTLVLSDSSLASATSAIHRYKKILHESDPAHGIFSIAWVTKVADAFMYLETRDDPAPEVF